MPEAEILLLTEIEAADLLAVHPGTLSNWRNQKVGPPYVKLRTGGVRYSKTDLAAWVESQTVDPSASAVNE